MRNHNYGRKNTPGRIIPENDLEDYYTYPEIAKFCASKITEKNAEFIEPCAGNGSFLQFLPAGTLAYDVKPMAGNILKTNNSLDEEWGDRICVTNPPFKHTKDFINKALTHSEICYFIMQTTLLMSPQPFYIEKLYLFLKGRRSVMPFVINSTGETKEVFACFAKIRRLKPGEKSNLPLVESKDFKGIKNYNFRANPFQLYIIPEFAEVLDLKTALTGKGSAEIKLPAVNHKPPVLCCVC